MEPVIMIADRNGRMIVYNLVNALQLQEGQIIYTESQNDARDALKHYPTIKVVFVNPQLLEHRDDRITEVGAAWPFMRELATREDILLISTGVCQYKDDPATFYYHLSPYVQIIVEIQKRLHPVQ